MSKSWQAMYEDAIRARRDDHVRIAQLEAAIREQCSREGCHCPSEIKGECAFCILGELVTQKETKGKQGENPSPYTVNTNASTMNRTGEHGA